ncbi:MAG: hypothetical protein AAGA56_16265 [Myxococcota bacterium]
MMIGKRRPSVWWPCLTWVALGMPSSARAEGGGPHYLVVDAVAPLEAKLRAAVAAELGSELESGPPRRVYVRVDARTILVELHGPGGTLASREVSRPDNPNAVAETVALLAGNVARDQVEALLPPGDAGDSSDANPAWRGRLRIASEEQKVPLPIALASTHTAPRLDFGVFQLALAWPVALPTNGEDQRIAIDTSVLFGRAGSVVGVGLHGLGSMVAHQRTGVGLTGLVGYRGGNLRGLEAAGLARLGGGRQGRGATMAGVAKLELFSEGESKFQGAQIAGVLNAVDQIEGGQFSFGLNMTRQGEGVQLGLVNVGETMAGAQLAGLHNLARRIDGVQLGGITNVAETMTGGQIAAASNHADMIRGFQLSAGVNTARRVSGAQVGLVNIAKHVSGTQIGVLNIAEENEGTAVGLVNVAGDGALKLATWGATSSLSNVGLYMRVGPLVAIPAFGYHPVGGGEVRTGIAFGGHLDVGPVFVELMPEYAFAHPLDASRRHSGAWGHHEVAVTTRVGHQPAPSFGFFGGVGARLDVTDAARTVRADPKAELIAGLLLF